MKTLTLTLHILTLICFGSCSQDFEKISREKVNQEQLDLAELFANDYLTTLKEGSTYDFKDEAIDAFKDQLTPDRQKAVYGQLKESLGDFQSLEYIETYVTGDKKMGIYRFKGDFSKSINKAEIRVVINEANEIDE